MTEFRKFVWTALLVLSIPLTPLSAATAQGKDEAREEGREDQEAGRKVITRVTPAYPPLARQGHLMGTVKLVAVVTPEGVVKSVRTVGGNPILAAAAEDAVKHWKYEATNKESSEAVALKFSPDK